MAHDGLDPIKKPGMLLKRKASLVFFCNLHMAAQTVQPSQPARQGLRRM